MRKKRILILGKLPPPFMGPAIATAVILNSSLKEKYELIHLNTKANESLRSMGKMNLSKFFKLPSLYVRMLGLLLFRRPELVLIPISQTTKGFLKDLVFILLSRLTFTKTLIHLRGSNFLHWFNHTSPWMQKLTRWSIKETSGVIVLGEKLKSLFSGFYKPENIFVVPNGADYSFPDKKSTNPVVEILYLATLMEEKGISDVVEAACILKKWNVNFQLTIVGDWLQDNIRDSCLTSIRSCELPVSIHSSKGGAAKLSFFSAADIFVFPPRDPEGHPWVIVEAMAAGLPVISTDKGAISESVINNVNGFIVPDRSPHHIASKLKQLIEDPELLRKMGEASGKLYREKFTEEQMVKNLSAVFEKVIAS